MNFSAYLAAAWRPRLLALDQLWTHRRQRRLPLGRRLVARERDALLSALMPTVFVVSLMVGALMFVTLPAALGDAHVTALAALWPTWVLQGAPLTAALMLAMYRAPALALDLTQRQQRGEFAALALLQAGPAHYPCVALLAAQAQATACLSALLMGLPLLLGLGLALVLATGDLAQTTDAVLGLIRPAGWMLCVATAWGLGLTCSLATMLMAWPGTQSATTAAEAHRLGQRAMLVSTAATLAAAGALHWALGLLN